MAQKLQHICVINEEASDKVLEVEQKYNEVRRPVYIKRNEIIQSIPDFWLTAKDTEHNFFSWFGETELKNFSDGVTDEVAEIIKEDLWPNPLKYFNNEADEEDFDGDEDDEEKGSEDDEDGDQDDDEEEDDEDDS
ncbi:NAP1-related protein 2-like [Phoenix dactylifera]|uniref:NAP1-related protein 2-like n=1 Tax=Phoenix dactylifera TaxID=42345 RepID=A0A8B8ZYN3_PHODC|nr:NAP1-related protein 2-like [Phoenix dactylifera]